MECFRKYMVFSVVFCVPGLLGTSCVTPPSGIKTVDMTEQEDIPVPKNFELKHSYTPDWKFVLEEAKFRSWTGEYTGIAQVGEVVPWYITEMRGHKWHYRGMEEKASEVKVLYFEKENEVSEVRVSRRLDSQEGGYVTVVQAGVHPKGPEDFTVDEHLRFKEAGIRPASFTAKESDQIEEDTEAVPDGEKEPKGDRERSDEETDKLLKGAQGAKQPRASPANENVSKGVSSKAKSPGTDKSRSARDLNEIQRFEEAAGDAQQ